MVRSYLAACRLKTAQVSHAPVAGVLKAALCAGPIAILAQPASGWTAIGHGHSVIDAGKTSPFAWDGLVGSSSVVDNEWWMQESDPTIRGLLKQFASGELSAAEMNVIAQQLNQPQTQAWHGYVPRPGYARFTAPYLLQSPGAPVNVEGAWQDPTLATHFTPEQQRAFDALVRKYPTAQPPDTGD